MKGQKTGLGGRMQQFWAQIRNASASASDLASVDGERLNVGFDGKQTCRLDGLSRPETVAVCDAGVFAVYEWSPSSEFLGPRCRLQAFTPYGKRIFEHRPGAAVELPVLSANGRYLAFHTLAPPRESLRAQEGESVFLEGV